MQQINRINTTTFTDVREQTTTGFVTSKDGTTLGYRQLGHGPALLLVHGAMESAQSHMQLAELLADAFTVYLPDRRGRGMSGTYSKHYQIQQDVDDMDALLTKTGAHAVFGVSSGADIWLQAALSLPAIQKAALYEPALFINSTAPVELMKHYEREMAQGNLPAALVTAMKATQMGPKIFNVIPRALLERLTNAAMMSEDKKASPEAVTMRKLAPTLYYDFQLVTEMSGKSLETYKDIRAEVLLLGGSQSPAFLKTALKALEKVLPRARRVEFPGLNHGGSGNTEQFGKPQIVAQELRRFLA
jgi:pimeloyl-ACP methyl ester carboxylesterase